MLRGLEVWLHQHIFKVGWLLTKQLQTTTILYYAFFLPGIFLNQATFWLAAGFLNVRADSTLKWPEPQEIGELKLDFVRLAKSVDPIRLAIISTVPLLVGLVLIGHIANNVLNIPTFIQDVGSGSIRDFSTAVQRFTLTPDFWLWVYLAFAIANTMIPDMQLLRGWRILGIALGVGVAILVLLGAADEVILSALAGPVTDILNGLAAVFAIIIGLDLFAVVFLGSIEALIERVSGDSATFRDGKMVTMRREEMRAERAKALTARPKEGEAKKVLPKPKLGSVYGLSLPIPGPPGKEPYTPSSASIISPAPLPPGASLNTPERSTPAVVPSSVVRPPPRSDDTQ